MNFPFTYTYWHTKLLRSASCNFSCRGLQMAKEECGVSMAIDVEPFIATAFSHPLHRVIPLKFVLAELAYILSGRKDLATIMSYNQQMINYSDDKETLPGSYGVRLSEQFPRLIERLINDPYTRQACAAIFREDDCLATRTHIPCNVFLQFMCRPPLLDLHVTSRSSDFVTGFSIDTVHWQALHVMMANELSKQLNQPILPNIMYYNIASLHIYQKDIAVVEQWGCTKLDDATWKIGFGKPLSEVIERCQKEFTGHMTIAELCDVLGIFEPTASRMVELQQLFTRYRNKLER